MFQEEYKKAYDRIIVNQAKLQDLLIQAGEGVARKESRLLILIRPLAVSVLSLCLVCVFALPVLAKQIPAVYRLVQKFAPALAEYVLPEEVSDTQSGITMQVEAIHVNWNKAEVILSFRDAEGSRRDQINGKLDLYDSYRIYNYGERAVIGGAGFLEYDEIEDKAYFRIEITSDRIFDQDKVRLAVTRLLTRCTEEERIISLEERIDNPKETVRQCNGITGTIEKRERIPFFEDGINDTTRMVRVMDEVEWNDALAESLTITGLSYDEGVLRVQQCRGNFSEADRHIRIYLKDKEGEERIPDCSVGWKEKVNGEEILFDEDWFIISEEELEQYELFGMFSITDGCVNGNWEITINLGK